MQKVPVDEREQAVGGCGARRRDGGAIQGRCGGYESDAADDIDRSTGPLPPPVSCGRSLWTVRVSFSRAREPVAELAAPDRAGSAREGRPHRFLDLHLHQLASDTSLCPPG